MSQTANISKTARGKAIVISGNNVNIDVAMGWYMGMDSLPAGQLVEKMLKGLKIEPFTERENVIVGGRNFGYGKSHPGVFTALEALGVRCLVAETFASYMLQQSLMSGLLLLECPEILKHVNPRDELEVDPFSGTIKNLTAGEEIRGRPYPQFVLDVMASGGHLGWLAKKIADTAGIK
jgi:3-isopropylmalate/(R)-2-methylmalate dehydratase small subunit